MDMDLEKASGEAAKRLPPAPYVSRHKWAWRRVRDTWWEYVGVGVAGLGLVHFFGDSSDLAAVRFGLQAGVSWTAVRYAVFWVRARSTQERERLATTEHALEEAERQVAALTAEAPPLVVDFNFAWTPATTSVAAGTRSMATVGLDYADPEPRPTWLVSQTGITLVRNPMVPSATCLCTVRNYGGRRLLGGVLVFDVVYFTGEYLTEATTFARQSISVDLPFMAIDEVFEFQLANLTGYEVSVGLPPTALVELEGESHQRTARVHASQASGFRYSPEVLLPPLIGPPPVPKKLDT